MIAPYITPLEIRNFLEYQKTEVFGFLNTPVVLPDACGVRIAFIQP